jgi:hypothetical protein
MSKRKYKVQDFIDAIPNSGGIISTIASRVGCSWHTVKKWIDEYPTVKAVYDDECETIGDLAESVIMRNIQLAQKQQKDAEGPVDSSDAKWYLSRVRRGKFATKEEVDVTSGGEPLVITYSGNVKPDEL